MMRVLSLGAGVQSSTLALMIAAGEVPMVDCAVFADTQGEPKAVYDWLNWLEGRLNFPLHRVTRGSLWETATRVITRRDGTRQYLGVALPVYSRNIEDGSKSMGMRQCTRNFKIDPINAKLRQLLGRRAIYKREGVLCEVLIGISIDETHRMKPARRHWIRNVWPLIDLGMNRADCQAWIDRKGYPQPPRSACIYCPYRSDEQWLALAADEFKEACEKETELQAAYAKIPQLNGKVPFFHPSRQPLAEVDLRRRAQDEKNQLGLFGNECAGMCGV